MTLAKESGQSGISPEVIEKLVVEGDLSKLTPAQRTEYYLRLCEAAGLNPISRPFAYLYLNGKLTLYAQKAAAEQLRAANGVSIVITSAGFEGDLYVVRARATTPAGRTDEAIGAVSVIGLKGDALANAIMKAETKAKRRVTLSICGMGLLDESEVSSIPSARPVQVDAETGEIVEPPPAQQAKAAPGAKPQPAKHRWAEMTARLKLTQTYMRELADITRALGLTPDDMAQACKDAIARGLVKGDAYTFIEDYLKEAQARLFSADDLHEGGAEVEAEADDQEGL